MFPHISSEAIENDLAVTGSVEETCENILTGRIVIPMPVPTTGSSSSSFSSKPFAPVTLSDALTPAAEPPKEWESDAAKRAENLRKRKEFMVQQARV
jgi:FixJ family two-component response regulator